MNCAKMSSYLYKDVFYTTFNEKTTAQVNFGLSANSLPYLSATKIETLN